jgi:hypothetical protein
VGNGTGYAAALSTKVDDMGLLAFVYCDRDRHYFISTCSNVTGGVPVERTRLRQVSAVETNEPPEHIRIIQNVPKAAAIYYHSCGSIDRHNRYRQATLELEKKIQTKRWDARVNTSILGMIVVDAYLLMKGCTDGAMDQAAFNKQLLTELIENIYKCGVVSRRSVGGSSQSSASTWKCLARPSYDPHKTSFSRVNGCQQTLAPIQV